LPSYELMFAYGKPPPQVYDSEMVAALRLIGADGCPGGWMVALEFTDHTTALERWDTNHLGAVTRRSSVVAAVLDIPIGLPSRGSRACDVEARQLLGWPRRTSVFPAPLRPMLAATSYQQAQNIRRRLEGKGCSRQAFGIQSKVLEVDELLRHGGAQNLYEGHPELTFQELAGGEALSASKHTPEGRSTRWRLLMAEFPALEQLDPGRPSSGDSLDAYACLWTARRLAAGTARWVPSQDDELDLELRIPMRIWF
jgi:predicted RNase H-like nuclease